MARLLDQERELIAVSGQLNLFHFEVRDIAKRAAPAHSQAVDYRETPPSDSEARYVESRWLFDPGALPADTPDHIIVPDGSVSITVIRLPSGEPYIGITGPSVRAHLAALLPGACYGGVRLRPGTAGSVLRCDIDTLRDAFGPVMAHRPSLLDELQSLLPAKIPKTRFADLLDLIANEVLETALPVDRPVSIYADRIRAAGGDISLADAAQDNDIGLRQLRRRFRYQCGLSPKEFARLRRVRAACLALLTDENSLLAQTAVQSGFADQAHMTRDFHDIFGNSTKLIEAYLRQIEHNPEMLAPHDRFVQSSRVPTR